MVPVLQAVFFFFFFFFNHCVTRERLPRWYPGKKFTYQYRCKRCGFSPWVEKFPWRLKWQLTTVFLPGIIPWTEEPGRLQSMGFPRVRHYVLSRFHHVRLCHAMDCSLPDSSVHGILWAGILEWVAMASCRESSWSREQTHISCISCITGRFFTPEPPRKPLPDHDLTSRTKVLTPRSLLQLTPTPILPFPLSRKGFAESFLGAWAF